MFRININKITGLLLITIILVAYAIIKLSFRSYEIFSNECLLLSFGLVLFTGYNMYICYERKALFSPLFFVSLMFCVHYGLTGIYYSIYNLYWNSDNSPYFIHSLVYIYIVYCFLLVINKLFSSPLHGGVPAEVFKKGFDEKRLRNVIILFCVIGFVSKIILIKTNNYFQISRGVQTDVDSTYMWFLFSFEIFTMLAAFSAYIQFLLTEKKVWKTVFAVLLILEFIYWLPTGRKEEIINLIMFTVVILYLIKKKLPSLKIVVPLAVFLLLLFPVTQRFRDAIGASIISNTQLTFGELINVITTNAEVVTQDFSAKTTSPDDKYLRFETVRRLSHIEELSGTVGIVRSEGSINGKTYLGFIGAFIPRIIWPNKPILSYGNDFGQRIGLIDLTDLRTSTSITIPAESFLNLGWGGFIIFLFPFAGAFFFYKKIILNKYQAGNLLLYIIYLKVFTYLGGDFVSQYSGVIKNILMFLPIIYYLKPDSPKVLKR